MEDEGQADHDALAHAPGELVGILVEPPAPRCRGRPASSGPLRRSPPSWCALVDADRLDEVVLHRHQGVERGQGVLEDHRDVRGPAGRGARARPSRMMSRRPCRRCSPATILPGGFMSFRMDRPSVDFPQPDSPTMPSTSPLCTESETSLDRADRADRDGIGDGEALDVEDASRLRRRACQYSCSRGLRISERPSPSIVKPRARIMIIRPG